MISLRLRFPALSFSTLAIERFFMSSRGPIGIAVAANCLVAGATYAVQGWNAAGAHAAARNTARFSLAWFVVAFAAPALTRFIRNLPAEAVLIRSFVGAHVVHFATVLSLLVGFESAHLAEHPGRAAAVIGIGFSVVVLAGVTASPRASRLYTAVHEIALYVVFLIFFAGYAVHPIKPLRAIGAVLGVALILRLVSGMTFWRARVEAEESRTAAQG